MILVIILKLDKLEVWIIPLDKDEEASEKFNNTG